MKKQFIFVLAIATLSFTSCEEDHVKVTNPGYSPVTKISSFYPESGEGGTVVAIFGENFGPSISDNHVTFNGMYSEVTQVQTGTIMVRVPLNIPQGDYQINVSALGQTVTSTRTFKVGDPSPTH
jgi:IPT/TIG domain